MARKKKEPINGWQLRSASVIVSIAVGCAAITVFGWFYTFGVPVGTNEEGEYISDEADAMKQLPPDAEQQKTAAWEILFASVPGLLIGGVVGLVICKKKQFYRYQKFGWQE